MTAPTADQDLNVIKSIVASARADVQKVTTAAESLRSLTNQPSLDRSAIRTALLELKAAVEAGKWTSFGAMMTINAKLLTEKDPNQKASITETITQIGGVFVGLSASISNLVSMIDKATPGDDSKIREAVTNLYWPYIDFSILFGKISHVLDIDPIGGLGWIIRLLKLPSLSLDENWAIATCYLAAMEITVNRVSKAEGLGDDPREEFQDKFSRVLSILGRKGKQVTGLQRLLPQAFWKLRNDVIHAGYSPSAQEIEILLPWVTNTIKTLTAT